MANSIKYSESSESLALNKGNWWIGTGDSNKGPTVESGYWNAINPPDGGYTVYLNKESNGPSIHSIADDEKLISFTNKISGNNYTTVAECLVYYQTQDDKLCVNREYENIVTDGLVLNLDAGYVPSYPTSGTTWYDLSGNGNDGSLVNGPTYSGGSMVFDGVNDYIDLNQPIIKTEDFTVSFWFKDIENNGFETWYFSQYTGQGGRLILNKQNYSSGQFRFFLGSVKTVFSTINLNIEEIYHITCTKTASGIMRIYINGILNNEDTGGITTIPQVSTNLSSPQNNRAVNGNIFNCQVYNRALSATEVLQNYNAQKGRFGL